MRKVFFFAMLMVSALSNVYAQSEQEIEQHYQKGSQYFQQGAMDSALMEFSTIVGTDHSNLADEYYVQTYADAFANMGIIYGKKNDLQKSKENFLKSLEVQPDGKKAGYWLAFVSFMMGEIAQAKQYYAKVKDAGFPGEVAQMGDFAGKALAPFADREIDLDYISSFDSTQKSIIKIIGNPVGDNGLLASAVGAIEKLLMIDRATLFSQAKVEYVRNRENSEIMIEKWVVSSGDEEKTYWVRYDFTPPADFPFKTMVEASGQEILE